jgi:hypothetical protein
MLPVGEVLKGAGRIITDRSDAEPLISNRCEVLFQLDELDLAPWSPVGGTKENDHRTVLA